jgi:hypothetical protein
LDLEIGQSQSRTRSVGISRRSGVGGGGGMPGSAQLKIVQTGIQFSEKLFNKNWRIWLIIDHNFSVFKILDCFYDYLIKQLNLYKLVKKVIKKCIPSFCSISANRLVLL